MNDSSDILVTTNTSTMKLKTATKLTLIRH